MSEWAGEAQVPSAPAAGLRLRWGPLAAVAFGLLAALWLSDVAGAGVPRAVARAAAALAGVLGAVFAARLAGRLWRGEVLDRFSGRLLVLLAAAAIAVAATGLGHEVGGLYFADEGTFLAQAQRINAGRPLRGWFVYPHFLFYWDAFALWCADLGGSLVPAAARRLWGVAGELEVAALVTRAASGALAAAAVVVTALAGRLLAGAAAGAAAGALLLVCPSFVEIGHLNLADVPASFFAACTLLAVAALLARETSGRWWAAGVAAGLAAGSKYPAGLAATAIAGPWLRGWLARRRPSPGLVGAGVAAIVAFLASTPSLLRFPQAAFGGEGADLLFGARLYSEAGWQGIVRASNARYYLGELDRAFGGAALALGLAGVVVLGAGLAGWLAVAGRRLRPGGRRAATAAVLIAALAVPAATTAVELVRRVEPTTREEAAAWMRENLPPGSFLVQEQYTPIVGPEALFPARRPRFAGRLALDVLRDPRHDFVLLSSEAYQRFLDPRNLADLANAEVARRYREIFAGWPLVREWAPGRWQGGPVLRLYLADPEPPPFVSARSFDAADALVSDPAMRPAGAAEVAFSAPGSWALFKAYLEPGAYRARWTGEGTGEGRLGVRDRANRELAAAALGPAGEEVHFALPRADKVFLYLELAPGCRLRGLEVAGSPAAAGPEAGAILPRR